MSDDVETLTEQWILTFCEAPILIDPELMRRVLADYERDLRTGRRPHPRKTGRNRSGRSRVYQGYRGPDGAHVLKPVEALTFRGEDPCDI